MVGPPLSSSKSADKGFNENSHDDLMKLMKCWENVMEILQRDECRISKGTGEFCKVFNKHLKRLYTKFFFNIVFTDMLKLVNCNV